MTNKNFTLEDGQVCLAFFEFIESLNGNTTKKQGKYRPVVIFENPLTNEFNVCKISSNIESLAASKYGYTIEDWENAGLKAPSAIFCNSDNVRVLDPKISLKHIGNLNEKDLEQFLERYLKVLELEKEKNKGISLER